MQSKFGLTLECVYTLRWPESYCVEEWSVGHVVSLPGGGSCVIRNMLEYILMCVF